MTLLDLCRTVCPTGDGRPPEVADGPHAVLYGGTPRPSDLRLDHTHSQTVHDWQLVAISNSPHSVRLLVDALIRAVDSQPATPTDRYQVTYASPPIEDRDDPSQWRWTSTAEITLTTSR